MAKSYNYTIAQTHQGKIYIPYIGIEIKGYSTLFASILGFITVTVAVGFPLSFVLGTNAYFVGLVAAALSVTLIVSYTNEVNNETGRTKLKEFYYLSVKKFRYVYDSKGIKHYLQPKNKGVVYINAYRTNSRL